MHSVKHLFARLRTTYSNRQPDGFMLPKKPENQFSRALADLENSAYERLVTFVIEKSPT